MQRMFPNCRVYILLISLFLSSIRRVSATICDFFCLYNKNTPTVKVANVGWMVPPSPVQIGVQVQHLLEVLVVHFDEKVTFKHSIYHNYLLSKLEVEATCFLYTFSINHYLGKASILVQPHHIHYLYTFTLFPVCR